MRFTIVDPVEIGDFCEVDDESRRCFPNAFGATAYCYGANGTCVCSYFSGFQGIDCTVPSATTHLGIVYGIVGFAISLLSLGVQLRVSLELRNSTNTTPYSRSERRSVWTFVSGIGAGVGMSAWCAGQGGVHLRLWGEAGYDVAKDIIISLMAGLYVFSALSIAAVWIDVVESSKKMLATADLSRVRRLVLVLAAIFGVVQFVVMVVVSYGSLPTFANNVPPIFAAMFIASTYPLGARRLSTMMASQIRAGTSGNSTKERILQQINRTAKRVRMLMICFLGFGVTLYIAGQITFTAPVTQTAIFAQQVMLICGNQVHLDYLRFTLRKRLRGISKVSSLSSSLNSVGPTSSSDT